MNKLKFKILCVYVSIVALIVITASCRRNFEFEEITNFNNDSIFFEGTIAGTILNSDLTVMNFVPEKDSTLWVETGVDGLVHLRMYKKSVAVFTAQQVLGQTLEQGTWIPAVETSLRSQKMEIKVYNNALTGKLFFKDPKFTLIFKNYLPLVTRFKLDTITFFDKNDNQMSSTYYAQYQNIPAPTSIGGFSKTSLSFTKSVIPGLDTLFSPVPKHISFFLRAGTETAQFLPYPLSPNDSLVVDSDVDLPLDARLNELIMSDTIDMKWDQGIYKQIKSVTIKLRLKNGYPVNTVSQLYFMDTTITGELGTKIDSLFIDNTNPNISAKGWNMKPATLNSAGESIDPSISYVKVYVDQARITRLKNLKASKVLIIGSLNTDNNPTNHYVKILPNYKMGVKLGVKADLMGSSNDSIQ